jgi:hypothetical protein
VCAQVFPDWEAQATAIMAMADDDVQGGIDGMGAALESAEQAAMHPALEYVVRFSKEVLSRRHGVKVAVDVNHAGQDAGILAVWRRAGSAVFAMLAVQDLVLLPALSHGFQHTLTSGQEAHALWRGAAGSLGLLRVDQMPAARCIRGVVAWLRKSAAEGRDGKRDEYVERGFVEPLRDEPPAHFVASEFSCGECADAASSQPAPRDRRGLTHKQQLLWQCHGFAQRFDCAHTRVGAAEGEKAERQDLVEHFGGGPGTIIEMDYRRGSTDLDERGKANLELELIITVVEAERMTRRRFVYYTKHALQNVMVYGDEERAQGFQTPQLAHRLPEWCPCLPRAAVAHCLQRPEHAHVKGRHVVLHNVSAAPRSDEASTRMASFFQEIAGQYGFKRPEWLSYMQGHDVRAMPCTGANRASAQGMFDELERRRGREPDRENPSWRMPAKARPATLLTRRFSVAMPARCLHCHKEAGAAPAAAAASDGAAAARVRLSRCSRCQMVAFCGRDCQRAAWRAHKQDCDAFHAGSGFWTCENSGGTDLETMEGMADNHQWQIDR